MEKSEVREFGFTRSIYNSKIMGSSIIGSPTSSAEREFHLRKSRIVNIPDSKKQTMCGKLDFVVVFQSIEIERLSEEVEVLRAKIKQYERQLFNSDNYQIQIKQLTQKCYRLENERDSYRQELLENKQAGDIIMNELEILRNKNMSIDFTSGQKYKLQKARNEELMLEVEKWKNRYNTLDDSKTKELQAIKKIMEEQKKNTLSRETKELFDRFDLEREQMQRVLKELKRVNVEKQTELKKVKFELQKQEKDSLDLEKELDDYEEKVALLSQENYRLNELVKSKQNQINRLKQQVLKRKDEKERAEQQKTLQLQKISNKLKLYEQRISEKQADLNSLKRSSLNDKEKLSQMERISFLLRQKSEEAESKQRIIERKDKKIVVLQEQILRLEESQHGFIKVLVQLKGQVVQAAEMIKKLLERIKYDEQIISKVRAYVVKLVEEVQGKHVTIQQQLLEMGDYFFNYAVKLITELQSEKEYAEKMQMIKQGHQVQVERLKSEKLQLLERNQKLKQKAIVGERREEQLTSMKNYLDKLLDEKAELAKQNQLRESAFVSQTQKTIEELKQNYENNIISTMQLQMTSKGQTIRDLSTDNQKMRGQLQTLSAELSTLQAQNSQLQTFSVQTQEQIREKDQLIDSLYQDLHEIDNVFRKQYQQQHALTQRILQSTALIDKTICWLKRSLSHLIQEGKNNYHRIEINKRDFQGLCSNHVQLMESHLTVYSWLLKDEIIPFTQSVMQQPSVAQLLNQQKPFQNMTKQNCNTSNVHLAKQDSTSKIKQLIVHGRQNITHQTVSKEPPLQFLFSHVLLCAQLQALRKRIGDKNGKHQQIRNTFRMSNISSKSPKLSQKGFQSSEQESFEPIGSAMSNTFINKLSQISEKNRFVTDNENTFVTSRLLQTSSRLVGKGAKRVNSQEHLGQMRSDSSVVSQKSSKMGIYTNKKGTGKTGFKFIGVKKSSVYH